MGGSGEPQGQRELRLVGPVLFGADDLVSSWLQERVEGYHADPNSRGLGVWDGYKIVAAANLQHFNGRHGFVNIAADPQATWSTRRLFRILFFYPFVTLECDAISCAIASTNAAGLNFAARLGFDHEAILKFAAHDGSSLVVMKMLKENCRWIK